MIRWPWSRREHFTYPAPPTHVSTRLFAKIPIVLDVDAELAALEELVRSDGWKLVEKVMAGYQENSLRDNLKAHDMDRVGENRGKSDAVDALGGWPSKRIAELRKQLNKGGT